MTVWAKVLKNGQAQARQFVAPTRQYWKTDPDLAGIRDQSAAAGLPPEERKACQALWAKVDAVQALEKSN
jgi:hypothetical protein